jgi:hypothetical protein
MCKFSPLFSADLIYLYIHLYLFNLFLYFHRYGIRVDPEQWLIVLTGRHEGGADHPSVILLICMYLPFNLIAAVFICSQCSCITVCAKLNINSH